MTQEIRVRPEGVTVDEKRCPQCEQVRPWWEWNLSKHNRSGLAGWCKECESRKSRSYRQRELGDERPASVTVEAKQCPSCMGVKSWQEFGLHAQTQDGLQKFCRDCAGDMQHERWTQRKSKSKQAQQSTAVVQAKREAALPSSMPQDAFARLLFGQVVESPESEPDGRGIDPVVEAKLRLAEHMIDTYGEIIKQLIQ